MQQLFQDCVPHQATRDSGKAVTTQIKSKRFHDWYHGRDSSWSRVSAVGAPLPSCSVAAARAAKWVIFQALQPMASFVHAPALASLLPFGCLALQKNGNGNRWNTSQKHTHSWQNQPYWLFRATKTCSSCSRHQYLVVVPGFLYSLASDSKYSSQTNQKAQPD